MVTGKDYVIKPKKIIADLRALVDFCELPVFAAATDPMIVIVNKGLPSSNHEIPVVVIKDEAEFETLHQSLASRGALYKPNQLKPDGWSLEGGDGLVLVEKMFACHFIALTFYRSGMPCFPCR